MTTKNFLCGVANCYAYDANDNLLFTSKTLIDSSIAVSTKMTEIRGGQGDTLQFQYFYGSDLKLTLTESQFSLAMIASNIGTSLVTGSPIWNTETITLGTGGAGVLLAGTPIATSSGSIYGWVTDANNNTTRVTFTGQNFTLAGGVSGQVVTVRYYENMAAAQSISLNANIIPSVVHLVMEAQLFSGDTTNSSPLIGKIFIDVSKFQLDGNEKIDLKSSGVSNTPLSGAALNNNGVYATITQNITTAHWYDNVIGLAIANTPISLSATNTTSTLQVYAIPATGSAFIPPYSDLNFISGTSATATVGASTGLVTRVAAGTSVITVNIVAKPSETAAVTVTCT